MSMGEPRQLYPAKNSGFMKVGKISSILTTSRNGLNRVPERAINDPEKVDCVLPQIQPRPNDIYECEYCKKPVSVQQNFHGWFRNPDGRAEACPKCSKPVIRARNRRKVHTQLKALVHNGTLLDMQNLPDNADAYSLAEYPGKKQYVEVVQRFVDGNTQELFLTGKTGRGKSGLSISAVHALHLQGKLVLFMAMEQYLDLLRENMGPGAQQNHIKSIMTSVDVAIIDDMGAGVLSDNSTGFAVKETQDLVEARHTAGLQTLISSNLTVDGLGGYWYLAKYERAGFQPSDRIVSRLKGWYRIVEIVGSDLRLGE
jgi:DNA replication protein DnaC